MGPHIFTVKSIYENDEDILHFRQEKIFNRLLLILLVSCLVPYIITLIVFGFFYFNGLISLGGVSSSEAWVLLVGTVVFLCAAATLSLVIFINRLIKDLEQEQQRLKEKLIQAERLKALGILAGTVAHDLNNTLSGIATYPEVLMMEKDLDPQIRQGLNIIKASGQKASALVSDLLTISRGSSAQMEIININSIIDRYTAARDFDKIRKACQRVKIEILTEPELLNIKGSYIHIEKTIMNLVLNAAEEVSGNDGGKVLISTANRHIDSSVPGHENIVPGEYVVLSVIDNGPGIDNKNLKKIFNPFFTKKEMRKSGTGLGLTVVWNVVQDHNGFISVISNNKGTTFDLLFPAIRQENTPKEE